MSLTILLSGMIGRVPCEGGATWAVLQYLLGFKRLGHLVYFVEPVASAALAPVGVELEDSRNARYFREVMHTFGLEGASALVLAGTRETMGLSYEDLRKISRQADVLVNISGLLTDETLLAPVPVRLYLDLDPAFTQLWHFTQGIDLRLAGHTHYATVGLAIGSDGCAVPTGGLDWITTLPPVVLDRWPRAERVSWQALTTVAHWRGYGSIEHDGVHYGQKAHSVRRLIDLPKRSAVRCVLALEIHPDEVVDVERLTVHEWQLVDPASVAATPDNYQEFVQGSWAELGVAKSGYVVSRSGWFSDRSACYLACGRPVIAQETGFGRWLPTGEGLLPFETTDDALAAIDQLRGAYDRHARAARAVAETCFDSDRVLASLIDRLASGR